MLVTVGKVNSLPGENRGPVMGWEGLTGTGLERFWADETTEKSSGLFELPLAAVSSCSSASPLEPLSITGAPSAEWCIRLVTLLCGRDKELDHICQLFIFDNQVDAQFLEFILPDMAVGIGKGAFHSFLRADGLKKKIKKRSDYAKCHLRIMLLIACQFYDVFPVELNVISLLVMHTHCSITKTLTVMK